MVTHPMINSEEVLEVILGIVLYREDNTTNIVNRDFLVLGAGFKGRLKWPANAQFIFS